MGKQMHAMVLYGAKSVALAVGKEPQGFKKDLLIHVQLPRTDENVALLTALRDATEKHFAA